MRLPRTVRLFTTVLAMVVLLGGSASGISIELPTVDWTLLALAADPIVDERTPCLNGDLIAWVKGSTIRVWSLDTMAVRTIAMQPGSINQAWPDISGDYVVYSEWNATTGWDVRRYKWSTNTSSEVAGGSGDQVTPKVDGNWVLWENQATHAVYSRNYDMGGHTTPRLELDAGGTSYPWDFDNGRLFLGSQTEGYLWMRNLDPQGFTYTVHQFPGTIENLQVHGTRVAAWVIGGDTDSDVYVYNLQTDSAAPVAATDGSEEYDPSIFEDTVTWTSTGAVDGIGYEMLNVSVLLTPSFGTDGADTASSLYGHRCAFQRSDAGDDDVWYATSDTKLGGRTSGANRYATAAATSKAYFDAASNVVLCNGANFPDALSAAPLARALSAPLLLTATGTLPPETLAEITRLDPDKVWVIGGTAAVSEAIYQQLDVDYQVERVSGADRYATSAAVARKLEMVLGADEVFRAFFARGDAFPDALAVGPVAAAANGPIRLVRTGSVPEPIADAVDDMDITMGYVIGGPGAVSDATDTALRALITANGAMGMITERWAGASRYDTAIQIAEKGLFYHWIDLDTAGFATGTNFPDALGGGAALGYYGSPLLLTDGTSLSGATATFLDDHRYEVGSIDVFGGTGAISAPVYDSIRAEVY